MIILYDEHGLSSQYDSSVLKINDSSCKVGLFHFCSFGVKKVTSMYYLYHNSLYKLQLNMHLKLHSGLAAASAAAFCARAKCSALTAATSGLSGITTGAGATGRLEAATLNPFTGSAT